MLEIVSTSVFYEVAALLVLAAGFGLLGVLLRQPLIVSFIAVGILAGPSVLGIARSSAHIDLFAELGIAVLLFLVGLKLDLKLVRTLGTVALVTGLGQVLFTSIIGFALGLALGFDAVTSIYVAVALTFSSTIIIVKLLSDKREIDSLHGRIALGFLIVQDLVVIVAMTILSALGVSGAEDQRIGGMAGTFAAGIVLLLGVGVFIRYAAAPLAERLARAPELLVCFTVGWAALFAAIGDYLGLSMELGGLLAGVSLASTRLRDAMATRLAPLRDFLLLFFFIALGAHIDLSLIGAQAPAAVLFSLFVLIGNPLIVLALMGALGYHRRTGFLAGLTVAQISEFSLIFMAMGVSLGHVSPDSLGLVTLVGLITISASTYMIVYSHPLYAKVEPWLTPFERSDAPREFEPIPDVRYDALLFGLGRFGSAIAQRLNARGWRILGVDFNPVVVRRWAAEGIDVVYGDATDPEFVATLPLANTPWVVAVAPEHEASLHHDDPRYAVIHTLRQLNFPGKIAVAAHRIEDRALLLESGADIVLLPFQDAADQAVDLIVDDRPPRRFEELDPLTTPPSGR